MNREPIRLPEAVLRNAVFKALESNQNLQFASMPLYVVQSLIVDRHLETGGAPASEEMIHQRDRLLIGEIIWELMTQGLLVPGDEGGGYNFPFFRLTEYGRRCISEQSITPHDYDNYMKNVRNLLNDNIDDIFILYLEESVEAFRKALYISATVNLGVSAERLVMLIIDKFETTLENQEKNKFQEAIRRAKHPAAQFEEVFIRLEYKKSDMPEGLRNSLDMLKFIQEIIRIERNDAGHPTGRRFSKEEAMTYLLTYPNYLKIYQEVIRWLDSEPQYT